jgi:hypothetical protein
MMREKHFVKKKRGLELNIKDMYILSDNDMIYGPGFDEYFISSLDYISSKYPYIFFLVKYPGGIPSRARELSKLVEIPNLYKSNTKIKIHLATGGGGSGCWVMDNAMLEKLRWSDADILKVFGKFKQHDTISWSLIRAKQNSSPYVAGIEINNEEQNPVLVHMGGKFGSICNSLTNNKYNVEKKSFDVKESELEKMTIEQILHQYRGLVKW